MVLFRVFLAFGLKYTSAVEAGIVTGSAPAVTALFTYLFLREPLTPSRAAGIAVTAAGILLLQGSPLQALEFDRPRLMGNGLILCATACESAFAVISRKMHGAETGDEKELAPVVHAGWVSIIALALCALPMLAEKPFQAIAGLSVSGWTALAWYGAVVTVLAFVCMFAGARHCDGYVISALIGVMPLSSLVLSILLLGESVSAWQTMGCGCILFSIAILNRRARRGARPH